MAGVECYVSVPAFAEASCRKLSNCIDTSLEDTYFGLSINPDADVDLSYKMTSPRQPYHWRSLANSVD